MESFPRVLPSRLARQLPPVEERSQKFKELMKEKFDRVIAEILGIGKSTIDDAVFEERPSV